MKVLIVEDDLLVQMTLKHQIEALGHQAQIYAEAQEALEAYQQTFFPLILLDLGLPDMDGLEFCRCIRQLPQGDRSMIFVATARDTPEDLQAVLEAGADDYMTKPIDLTLLGVRLTIIERQVQHLLERTRLEEELDQYRRHLEQLVEERTVELRQTNAELVRANRLKDEFFTIMSHELRTPLNIILGMSNVLEHQYAEQVDSGMLRRIKMIQESGRELLELVETLLDLCRIVAGKLQLHLVPEYSLWVCQRVLASVQEAADRKQITLRFPESPDPYFLFDLFRFQQILRNLLKNAIKFTPEGGTVGLDIHCDPDINQVHFVVWDTGIGIPPEQIARIFEPFVQLDCGAARKYGGIGIGLTLAYRLVELHGGTLTVESTAGTGSRFTVTLPFDENPKFQECSVTNGMQKSPRIGNPRLIGSEV